MKLNLEAIEARCKALDERMSDMSELAWTLEGPNLYGLFGVYDSDGNAVSHGIKERQDFIAHARRDVPALLAATKRLHRELHDERVRRDEWEKMYNQAIAGTEVEWLYERVRQVNTSLGHEVDSRVRAELEVERLQAELTRVQTDVNEVWAENTRLAASYQDDADAVCKALGVEWTDDNEYPTVALSAIARLQNELAATKRVAQLWFRKAMERRRRLTQVQDDLLDEVQELWLSPVEAEGLKQQLAKAEAQIAVVREAVEWLWGFWEGNSLRAIPGFEDDIRDAWVELLRASSPSDATAQLLERLEELDAAEDALAGCGIAGIRDEFDGLADAIQQVSEHIKKLEDEPMIEVEIKGVEMVQALQAERKLRREAERRAEVAEAANDHLRSVASQVPYYKHRHEQVKQRAEALAALVTPELAGLLERLAGYARQAAKTAKGYPDDVDEAYRDEETVCELAVHTREALKEHNGAG